MRCPVAVIMAIKTRWKDICNRIRMSRHVKFHNRNDGHKPGPREAHQYRAGGISSAKGRLRGTEYNPQGLTTNCGFCAIAKWLSLKTKTPVTADDLYVRALEHFDIDTTGPDDPISRQLIFPQARLDEDYASRNRYRALSDRGIALSSYTITSVAREAGLTFVDGDAGLLRWLLECQSTANTQSLKLEDYVNARLNVLRHTKGLPAQPVAVKKSLLDLPGNYIIGSKDTRHYLTLEVDGRLTLKAMDPQDGANYFGPRIKAKVPTIDLALKVI